MNWRFWEPQHTVQSVAYRLASGLRDGAIVLDAPFADEPFEDDINSDSVLLQIDIAEDASDDAILEIVKSCANSADRENRSHGGKGLRIGKVLVEFPMVKVALRPPSDAEQAKSP